VRTEEGAVSVINVDDPAAVDRFLAEDPDGPVTMLNLLRFQLDGGWESYLRYTEHTSPVTRRYGVRVVYFGRGEAPLIAESGQGWDAVLLVAYPSRRTFVDMIRDPQYRAGAHLRAEALVEAVLQPTAPMGGRPG
jgi:uncharacterized protein (DUF1330 family)